MSSSCFIEITLCVLIIYFPSTFAFHSYNFKTSTSALFPLSTKLIKNMNVIFHFHFLLMLLSKDEFSLMTVLKNWKHCDVNGHLSYQIVESKSISITSSISTIFWLTCLPIDRRNFGLGNISDLKFFYHPKLPIGVSLQWMMIQVCRLCHL